MCDLQHEGCIYATSCHNFIPRQAAPAKGDDVAAVAIYKVYKNGHISYMQWGNEKVLVEALLRE